MWLVKCPVPTSESLQIAIARWVVVESRRRHGQIGSPRVVETAWRLISTVTRSSAAGRCPSTGVTVPATCSAIGADSVRGSVCGLIQPRKETLHVAAADDVGLRDPEQGQEGDSDQQGEVAHVPKLTGRRRPAR